MEPWCRRQAICFLLWPVCMYSYSSTVDWIIWERIQYCKYFTVVWHYAYYSMVLLRGSTALDTVQYCTVDVASELCGVAVKAPLQGGKYDPPYSTLVTGDLQSTVQLHQANSTAWHGRKSSWKSYWTNYFYVRVHVVWSTLQYYC